MDKKQLSTLVSDYSKLRNIIITLKPIRADEKVLNQIEVDNHAVKDPTKRIDKIVTADTGQTTIPVARIPVAFQKEIVDRAVGFLLGNPITISGTGANELEKNLKILVQKVWDDNKLDYDTKRIFRYLLEETEVAELWYTEEVASDYWAGTANQGKTIKLRSFVIAPSLGDYLYPVFDNYGDLIAFGRQYYLTDENAVKIEHFDLYTDDTIYYANATTESTWLVEPKTHTLGKIPIIYYPGKQVAWHDVQDAICRYETSISNHADANDYNGSPLIAVIGEIKSFAKKGEQGKVVELKNGSDIKTVSWAEAPNSIKLEQENLTNIIHNKTDTPDISFQTMKGLGTFSGIALKMLFLGAHMKASNNEETFGKGIQRRLNFIKYVMTKINNKLTSALPLTIKPTFTYYLPKDDAETLKNIQLAITTGIMSIETGIELNPLISNIDVEKKRIETEAAAKPPAPPPLPNPHNPPTPTPTPVPKK